MRVTTLPPLESHPIIFMKFTDKVNQDLLRLIIRRMQEVGLKVIEHESEDPPIIIGITTTQERLEREAQSIRLQKLRYDTRIMDVFDIEQKDKFCDTSIPYRDSIGLFSSNDRSLLVSHIIEKAAVLPTGKKSSTLSQELDFLATPYMERNVTRFVKIHNKMRDLALDLAGVNRARHILCNILQEDGYIDIISPVHTTHGIKDDIWKDISSFRIMPPIETIREYYGEEVAFYFAWMGILTKWLCFPALFGLLATVYRWYRKDSIMSDEYTPFYGLMTFLWSVLFLKWWRRHEARLCYKWGVLVGEYEKRKYFDVRPEFYGSFRSSPVTGELELFYPEYKRLLKFMGSAIVTIAMLFIAFWTMILSLNLQGYINPKNHPERWHEGNIHPFHWPQISQLAEPGALFDMHSPWRSLIPVALHVTTISTFNAVYRVIATRLTEWENHPTELAFSNSLILKRFLFEAFDCYVGLFYLAFYERDIEKLGQELVSIFNMDTLRRVTVECIVPLLMQRYSMFMRRSTKIDKKDDSHQSTKYTPLTDQANLGVYEQFDE
jgi:anoctamin-10